LSVLGDPELERLLADLHARSDAQVAAMRSFEATQAKDVPPPREDAS
jgi:hypothetical protein